MAYFQNTGGMWRVSTSQTGIKSAIKSKKSSEQDGADWGPWDRYQFVRNVSNSGAILYTNNTDYYYPWLATFRVLQGSFDGNKVVRASKGEECGLWFCVQAYKSFVREGVQTEDIIKTISVYLDSKYLWGSSNRSNSENNWILPLHRVEFEPESLYFDYASVTASSVNVLNRYFDRMFHGTFNLTPSGLTGLYSTSSSEIMTAIHHFNVSTVVRKLVKSMTNHIRTHRPLKDIDTTAVLEPIQCITLPNEVLSGRISQISGINGSTIPIMTAKNSTHLEQIGKAYTSRPFFHVRWAWITLPVLLTMLSPAFVLATILASYESEMPVFGSGLMALVGCHIDGNIRERVGNVSDYDSLKKRLKGVKVEMLHSEKGEGWQLNYVRNGRESGEDGMNIITSKTKEHYHRVLNHMKAREKN
ncbi:hypothetical protein B0J11DRAFT_581365 [Dendryphion nanum]|uniref:Uncharacterized protein n=1 Tax=Dendryphion nanum TaxID=256645 RepID=A0A9P9IJL9_9PLEO|nr:hypothetical protein B0J11DRAFT_581365 [Dendryphion nanum]